MNECMAEMPASIPVAPKQGGPHFFAPDKNYWGGRIVAGQTPLGAGLAFALKYKASAVVASAFSETALLIGAFMETLNLVSLWDIPVIFVIENNGYSMGASLNAPPRKALASRAEGFGIEWETCDGHDVFEVREVADRAMTHARDTLKPFLLEIRTYRYRGHSVADANHVSITKEEIEEYKKNKTRSTSSKNNS